MTSTMTMHPAGAVPSSAGSQTNETRSQRFAAVIGLLLGLVLVGGGCRAVPVNVDGEAAPDANAVAGDPDGGSGDGVRGSGDGGDTDQGGRTSPDGAARPASPAPYEGRVAGRVLVIAADDDLDDPTNVAWSYEPVGGEATRLWRTEEPEVLAWRASPDGRHASYRESWHAEPRTEALVARALEPGAEADYLVLLDPEVGRLAGHAWAPSSDAIAYGRQLGGPERFDNEGEGPTGWELRAVSVGGARSENDSNDRVLWRAEPDDAAAWAPRLLAWHPESARAIVVAAPRDGGLLTELWWVDTAAGRLAARHAPLTPAIEAAVAPGGQRVAWLDPEGGLSVWDVDTGAEIAAWPAPPGSGFATRPLWSADGAWVAWTVYHDDGATTRGTVRWARVADAADAHVIERPDWSVEPLAFGPVNELLVAAEALTPPDPTAPVTELPERELWIVETPDAAPGAAGWSLPTGAWDAAWAAEG